MRSFTVAAALAALTFSAAVCGGDYGSPSPTGPTNVPPPAGAITIDVVGINGMQSFAPNPVTVPADGQSCGTTSTGTPIEWC